MRRLALAGSLATLAACGVSPVSGTTGGAALDGGAGGACPRALAVVDTDYASTNVSLVSPDGQVRSASLVSSASAAPGLTTALSGDVVLPLARPASGEIVLIDRYPNAVLTWLDPATGGVLAQASVATGFSSNPHDYLEVGAHRAYVTRYGANPSPGREPFDEGGDLLVLDTTTHAVTGRVALAQSGDGAYAPHPDRMVRVGGAAWVSLQRFDASFASAADARVVGVDVATDAVRFSLDLPGLANCGSFAASPSGKLVALACSGVLGPHVALDGRSAVVLLDATAEPPVELRRLAVAVALGAPLAPPLAFASEVTLVGVAFGDVGGGRSDVAYAVDARTGAVTRLLDAGAAFALGDVRCSPGCSGLCWLADAHAGALRSWDATTTPLAPRDALVVDTAIGLPPRGLGEL